jgi:citrate lyase subunit beta / citryl-CoA lyase
MERKVYRSYLYAQGHQLRQIEKAYATSADAIVLDLEDAVAIANKDEARTIVAGLTAQQLPKPTFVRVNPLFSGRCADDVRAVAGPGLAGIRLPKVEHPDDVRQVTDWLEQAGCAAEIHLLVESARALEMAYSLATASSRVRMLGLGEEDLRADLRSGIDSTSMDVSRARCVIVSRAAQLPSPAQSVYPQVRDLGGLRASSQYGRAMGFLGRMAIHPSQLPVIHEVYTPTDAEISDARAVTDAARRAMVNSASIVITEDGRTVGPPMLANARQLLDLADCLQLECK